ncbi:MAG TPA: L-aspartate oxidase [Streptosporangiaceae bacterium]
MDLRPLPAAPLAWEQEADVVIVGAGVAGLSAALEASAAGRRVLLVGKAGLDSGSSPLAQGGLAAVLDPADSAGLHRQDTVTAGAGLCDDAAVAVLVAAAPGEISWLTSLGARFDTGPLGLEGGHSRPRIVHAGGDASGAEVHRALRDAVLAQPGVRVCGATVALDALTDERGAVTGLLAGTLTGRDGGLSVGVIRAAAVVLATGGYGQAYATTTNPAGATGDGLALAARAGVTLAGLEFMQFHPTVMWQPGGTGQRPLITEALRGAGAVLVDGSGAPVMAGRHPRGDLAPRDVVAAEMHRVMAAADPPAEHLWLDATGLRRAELEAHFPTVTAACRAAGIEPSREPIPVAPGAHFACGGISADMTGRTSVAGLYAVGEVAATGVHGANRLASNSLTEAIATGRRLGRLLGTERGPAAARDPATPPGPAAGASPARAGGPLAGAAPGHRAGLAAAMSRYAGILRDRAGLEHLRTLLDAVPPAAGLDLATVEATNLHTVSALVTVAALARTESRGCHRRSDAPETAPGPPQRTGLRWRDGRISVSVLDSAIHNPSRTETGVPA